jgi:hypothetical protein
MKWMLTIFNSDDYHLPEDDNHHSHRRGNLKSYIHFQLCPPLVTSHTLLYMKSFKGCGHREVAQFLGP